MKKSIIPGLVASALVTALPAAAQQRTTEPVVSTGKAAPAPEVPRVNMSALLVEQAVGRDAPVIFRVEPRFRLDKGASWVDPAFAPNPEPRVVDEPRPKAGGN